MPDNLAKIPFPLSDHVDVQPLGELFKDLLDSEHIEQDIADVIGHYICKSIEEGSKKQHTTTVLSLKAAHTT